MTSLTNSKADLAQNGRKVVLTLSCSAHRRCTETIVHWHPLEIILKPLTDIRY